MRSGFYIFLLAATLAMILPTTVWGQDSTDVILVRDITVKKKAKKDTKGKFTAAPHYTSEMGLGVAMTYVRQNAFSILGNVTTKGYILIGANGTSTSKKEKWEFSYNGYYNYAPSYFWGLGYEAANLNSNRTRYDKKKVLLEAEALYRASRKFKLGPVAGYEWTIWEDLYTNPVKSSLLHMGLSAIYDTRDCGTNPSSGIYLSAQQRVYSNLSGSTTLQFDVYAPLWDGGTMAADIHSEFTYGDVEITMLPTIGGMERMRGYYYGRYRNNNVVSAQLELRQRIWQFISGAGWIGGANLWGEYGKFSIRHTLPNYGIGIRGDITKNFRLRLDYGFGRKGQNAFILSINEAF